MARKIEITATFTGATRKGNTVNGNPTWILHTSEGDLRTQSDGAIGHEVTNHTGGPEDWTGREVVFTVTGARRVYDWRLA